MATRHTLLFILKDARMGGAEKSMITVANALAERGHEVHMLLWDDGPLAALISDKVTRRPTPSSRSLWAAWRCTLKTIKALPQAKIITALLKPNVLASLAGLMMGRRRDVYITEHSNVAGYLADKPFITRLICHALVLCSYHAAGHVLSVTDANSRIAERIGRKKEGTIHTVGNPIMDTTHHADAPIDGWPDTDAPIILAVGRLVPVKHFSFLIDCMAELIKQQPAHLVIVGDGSEKAALHQQIHNLSLEDHVTLLPSQPHIGRCYHRANLLAVTSHHESFSMIMLEAFQHGLPVVAVDCPTGPRAISNDGQLAVLTPPSNHALFIKALAQSIKNGHSDEQMKQARKHHAVSYSPDQVAQRYETVFDA